ncbi:hypothetical protein [Specibacter cremeus]|uniref:hypothetical protein n=1 Tax=Specibacter cremeus TaxID=1629051 RepID=UPI0013DE6951|nr:hypothetical protein [Specibacter cremeus]
MNQSGILTILLAIAALAWILYRQLQARPIAEQRPYALMLVLAAAGLVQIGNLAAKSAIPAQAWAAMVIGLASAAVFGWWRGRLVRVWRAEGRLMRQGNWVTVVLWMAGLAIHLGVDRLGTILAPAGTQAAAAGLGTASLLLYLGITLAAQRVATLARAAAQQQPVPVSAV